MKYFLATRCQHLEKSSIASEYRPLLNDSQPNLRHTSDCEETHTPYLPTIGILHVATAQHQVGVGRAGRRRPTPMPAHSVFLDICGCSSKFSRDQIRDRCIMKTDFSFNELGGATSRPCKPYLSYIKAIFGGRSVEPGESCRARVYSSNACNSAQVKCASVVLSNCTILEQTYINTMPIAPMPVPYA